MRGRSGRAVSPPVPHSPRDNIVVLSTPPPHERRNLHGYSREGFASEHIPLSLYLFPAAAAAAAPVFLSVIALARKWLSVRQLTNPLSGTLGFHNYDQVSDASTPTPPSSLERNPPHGGCHTFVNQIS
ncbi:hypothetical protein E2C01_045107 [Portunus trituberculatus]|uniref:Uncharacterized protein n=1 Tax=Portunus trituberculatus TaxID=210409 RepID=A0A5B7FXD7_PORTR|nr:hypothetical protein [Portunus trituberculatus]